MVLLGNTPMQCCSKTAMTSTSWALVRKYRARVRKYKVRVRKDKVGLRAYSDGVRDIPKRCRTKSAMESNLWVIREKI